MQERTSHPGQQPTPEHQRADQPQPAPRPHPEDTLPRRTPGASL